MKLHAWFSLGRARVASDRGSVGVLMALVLFVVLGMLFMTWNTVELSKEKMRLQNAADSAALEHAVWQARGMNALQNLNDEAFLALDTASTVMKILAVAEGTAAVFAAIPFPICTGIAYAIRGLIVFIGGPVSWLVHMVTGVFIRSISAFYQYSSSLLGYLAAQQFAAANGADSMVYWRGSVGEFKVGIFSIGLSWPILDAFRLPVTRNENPKEPFVSNSTVLKIFEISTMSSTYKALRMTKAWKYCPVVCSATNDVEVTGSDGKKKTYKLGAPPGPTMWVAARFGGHIRSMPLDAWSPDESSSGFHSIPMFAVAAARCVSGDLVEHSPAKGNRPAGFGAGATAVLVPVSEFAGAISEKFGPKLAFAIFH